MGSIANFVTQIEPVFEADDPSVTASVSLVRTVMQAVHKNSDNLVTIDNFHSESNVSSDPETSIASLSVTPYLTFK